MMKQWHILAAAAFISLLLGFGGYLYYRNEYRSITQSREYEITTIGTLKIKQIEQWHREKLSDARIVFQSLYFIQLMDSWLHERTDAKLTSLIQRRLAQAQKEFGFENIFLSTLDGTVLLTLDPSDTAVCPASLAKIQAAIVNDDITPSDFYFCTTHQKIHYDFVAPVRNAKGQMIAGLVFRLDPKDYLYPLIQSWPTLSRTGETMILRREGDSVMFLNELRHKKNSALKYSLPLNQRDYASVQASLGNNGIYYGRDYRGVNVLGFSGFIPGTNWILVAKVDASEIFSELYYRAAMTVILTLSLILLVLSGSAYFYNARQKNLYHTLFDKEKELHERLEEFKTILYSIGDGVITTDTHGRIRQMNHAACELTGWIESEAQGRSLSDVFTIVHESTRLPIADPVQRVLNEGKTVILSDHIILISKKGKETPIADSGAPIRNDRGNVEGAVLIMRDRTEEHHAEEERRRLEYHLFRSQRAESVGTLAAGIAHDFNNILNVIIGNAELLASTVFDPEKSPRRINAIIKASERGSHVVRQLLAVARKTDILHLPVNVNDIIIELTKLLFETFPKTIAITTDLAPYLPNVNGDANQLHQVLLNLSVNARDAMPEGGTLAFRTSLVHGRSLSVRFPDADPIPYLKLEVEDTGTGMEESTRKQIFDPFFTTKEKGKGTGLGLAVAQGIIESHAGYIDVQSTVGSGTRFEIYLPQTIEREISIEKPAPSSTPVSGGHETILYIEDEENILDIAVELLESRGYHVLTAMDGARGAELFSEHRDRIGLVVSDFGLPKIDGAEVFRRVRGIAPHIPFIILTGYMPPEIRSRLMEEGISEIISKPHKPAELLAAVRRLLDSKRV